MSDIYSIYKTIYLNSNKSSKKTIFSNSTNINSYNKNYNFNLFKNISLIKPKSFLSQKKTKKNNLLKQNIFDKFKFFAGIKVKNRNHKNNYYRYNIIWSPNNKSNYIRKRLMLTNNSNSISLSKASNDKKIRKKINNENKVLQGYKKEKNKLTNLIEKQKIEIEKLKNKNKIYNQQYLLLKKENKDLNKKVENYNNNQEQLILLIKIIQSCGIDIDKLIDDYNNNINNYDINENSSNKCNESLSDLDINVESNSFIPITIEKTRETKNIKIKVPKLNFDKINKNIKNNNCNINYNKRHKKSN